MAFFAKHLWCNIVGCSTQGLLPLTIKLNFGGQTEVTLRKTHISKAGLQFIHTKKQTIPKLTPCCLCITKQSGGHLTYFDLHVVVEEDVPQLQVSVNDFVLVQIIDSLQKLCHEVASFRFSHGFTTLVQLQQRLKHKIGANKSAVVELMK